MPIAFYCHQSKESEAQCSRTDMTANKQLPDMPLKQYFKKSSFYACSSCTTQGSPCSTDIYRKLLIFTRSKTLKLASLLARNQKLTIVDHMADGCGCRRGLVEHVVKCCKGRGAGTVWQRGLLHRGEVTTTLYTVNHPSVKK